MPEHDFQSMVLRRLDELSGLQGQIVEQMGRLVALESDNRALREDVAEIKAAHDEVFARIREMEEELSKWRTVRQFVAWLGPTGAIAAAIAFYQSTGGAGV